MLTFSSSTSSRGCSPSNIRLAVNSQMNHTLSQVPGRYQTAGLWESGAESTACTSLRPLPDGGEHRGPAQERCPEGEENDAWPLSVPGACQETPCSGARYVPPDQQHQPEEDVLLAPPSHTREDGHRACPSPSVTRRRAGELATRS